MIKWKKITPLMSNKWQKQMNYMMKYGRLLSQLKIQKFYLQRNRVNRGTKRKDKQIKRRIRMQARFNYARRI